MGTDRNVSKSSKGCNREIFNKKAYVYNTVKSNLGNCVIPLGDAMQCNCQIPHGHVGTEMSWS